jgi:ribosomal protein S18 acetylase RimI-like enzyme
MERTIFRRAQPDDYGELARWLVSFSQVPEQHCLHTWSGQSAGGLRRQLLSYWEASELCYVLALRGGRLVAAMGSEYDEGLKRGWLHGPHVALGDWDLTAAALFTWLLAALPSGIGQFDAYMNVENARGRRFYAGQGFTEREHLGYDFWLAPDRRVVSDDEGCVPLGREHETSFVQLYQTLFPGAYYGAQRIIDMVGQSHQVVVAAEGQEVLGFVVASVSEDRSTGEIQFFGVREDRRRQGYGRRLLLSAIDWLLDEAGVAGICLSVGEELIGAQSLYESVGFRLRFAGVGFRKILERSDDAAIPQQKAEGQEEVHS